MNGEILGALVALVMAILLGFLLKKPVEKFVVYLLSLSPKQINILIFLELLMLILVLIVLRNH